MRTRSNLERGAQPWEESILHIATTGIHYTVDGATWTLLVTPESLAAATSVEGTAPLLTGGAMQLSASPYYPRAIQRCSGEIVVVGHIGGDNAYGSVDQSVVLVRFKLQATATFAQLRAVKQ